MGSLYFDSVDVVELVTWLEEHYNVDLTSSPKMFDILYSVGSITKEIEKLTHM